MLKEKQQQSLLVQQTQTQIQKTKSKWKTIDEIMPKWSAYFDFIVEHPTVTEDKAIEELRRELGGINITSHATCCVGEAHGFKDDYYNTCDTCLQFAHVNGDGSCNGFITLEGSIDITNPASKYYIRDRDWRNTSTVKAFENHWNQNHI